MSDLRRIHIITYALLICFGVVIFLFQANEALYISYDDAYTMSLIEHSFRDILAITSQDVHPPLYYWRLRAYSLFVGDSLFALRTFSILGVLGMMLLACFPVRILFGFTVSLLFILLLILYPTTQNLAIDVRMYSWTAFFVLAGALYAYDICCRYRAQLHISGCSTGIWIKLTLVSLAAAYCHNYGLIAVSGIYIVLVITVFRNTLSANKPLRYKLLKNTVVSGSIVAILYSPWSYCLLNQMDTISGDYWIKPLTSGDLFLHMYYFYSPKIIEFPFRLFTKTQMMVGVIIVMMSQVLTVVLILVKSKRNYTNVVFFLALFLFPILVGFLFSILAFPILVPRYMLCVFPLFVLALAIMFRCGLELNNGLKKILVASLILLAGNGIMRHYTCIEDSKLMGEKYEKVNTFIQAENSTPANIIAYGNSSYTLSLLTKVVPNQKYAMYGDEDQGSYLPFEFDTFDPKLNSPSEIILVVSETQNNMELNKMILAKLSDYYVVTDTLYETGIYFYKMKAIRI